MAVGALNLGKTLGMGKLVNIGIGVTTYAPYRIMRRFLKSSTVDKERTFAALYLNLERLFTVTAKTRLIWRSLGKRNGGNNTNEEDRKEKQIFNLIFHRTNPAQKF